MTRIKRWHRLISWDYKDRSKRTIIAHQKGKCSHFCFTKRSNKKSEFHFIFKLRISGYESFTFRFLSRLYVSVVWKLDVKMPKRKITVTAKSTFWACGSCRRNCANTNSICCDSCKQWFHTDCENFPSEYLNHFNSPKVTYACNACFSAEIGDTNYNYAMGLNRLLQVFIYLFIYRGDRGTLGHGEHWDKGHIFL